jgi:chromosome segregation ATPase
MQLVSIAIALAGSIIGLNIWFIKRIIDQQDAQNIDFKKSVSTIREDAHEFKMVGYKFSKETEFKLERLEQKTVQWSSSLQGLTNQAEQLSNALFKIQTRVDVLIEKIINLEEKTKHYEARLTSLVGPVDIIKHEFDKYSKAVSDVEGEMKTLKNTLGKVILIMTKK